MLSGANRLSIDNTHLQSSNKNNDPDYNQNNEHELEVEENANNNDDKSEKNENKKDNKKNIKNKNVNLNGGKNIKYPIATNDSDTSNGGLATGKINFSTWLQDGNHGNDVGGNTQATKRSNNQAPKPPQRFSPSKNKNSLPATSTHHNKHAVMETDSAIYARPHKPTHPHPPLPKHHEHSAPPNTQQSPPIKPNLVTHPDNYSTKQPPNHLTNHPTKHLKINQNTEDSSNHLNTHTTDHTFNHISSQTTKHTTTTEHQFTLAEDINDEYSVLITKEDFLKGIQSHHPDFQYIPPFQNTSLIRNILFRTFPLQFILFKYVSPTHPILPLPSPTPPPFYSFPLLPFSLSTRLLLSPPPLLIKTNPP